VSGYEFTSLPEKVPETQTAFSGGPPQPPPRLPKPIAQDLLDPGGPANRVFIPDYIEVKELAELLGLKSFKIVADALVLRIFKHADELIDFRTAATIAVKHGFIAEKIF